MFILKDDYFLDGRHKTLNPAFFISPDYFADEYEYLIAFSHRWQRPMEDIASVDFVTIRNRIEQLHSIQKKKIAIFYDYSCIYQDKRVDSELPFSTYVALHGSSVPFLNDRNREETFIQFATLRRESDLKDLYLLMLLADEMYIMKDRHNDYYARCWCLLEAMIGRLRDSVVYRTKPSPYGENEHLFIRFSQILDNMEPARIFNIKSVKDFQAFLDSAKCMFDSDRALIKENVLKVIEKLFVYRWKLKTFENDYHYLLELLRRSKHEALLWSQGREEELLGEALSFESWRMESLGADASSSHYVINNSELDTILQHPDVRKFVDETTSYLDGKTTLDEIREHVGQMIKLGIIEIGKKGRD